MNAQELIDQAVAGGSVKELAELKTSKGVDPLQLMGLINDLQEAVKTILRDPETDESFIGVVEDTHDALNILTGVIGEAAQERVDTDEG